MVKRVIKFGILVLFALLALLLCVAPVAAAELVAGTPVTNEETGVITIPIILKNDLNDFVGFSAKVANSIPGVTVTIGPERPIAGAGYQVNSKEENAEQLVNALFYDSVKANTGIADADITLFTIAVKITDSGVTSLPLSITLRELLSASEGDIPLDTVKQIDLSGLRLTDTVTADVTSIGKEDDVPEYIPPTPILPTQSGNPTPLPTPSTAKPVGTEASSPGFGALAGMLGLFAGAGLLRRYLDRK